MASHARYAISKKIADGGMAEIFLARLQGEEGFERPVILKRVLPGLSADPKFARLLVDEAHVAMTLSHSNIVQVLDLGRLRGRFFLAMELVDGWDLSMLIERAEAARFAFPVGLALYIAAEVCRGLAYAHNRTRDGQSLSIVHRDISPQNILISAEGEVKITDFGIALALGRRENTRGGYVKGKVDFMSPEQASGLPVDGRSDLFSLGSVLYVMLTGRRPFEAATQLESMQRTQLGLFVPVHKARPDLDPEVAALVARAMRKEPADRFASAADMMAALETILRVDYQSMRQSDLQRWLADLGERDHAVTISRRDAMPLDEDDDVLAPEPGDHTVSLDPPDLMLEDWAADKIDDGLAGPAQSSAPLRLVPRRRLGRIALWGVLAAIAAVGLWAGSTPDRQQLVTSVFAHVFAQFGERARDFVGRSRAEAQAPQPKVSVHIGSDPPGATVNRNGVTLGTTPFTLTARAGGTFELIFMLPGYAPAPWRLTVAEGVAPVEVKLTKLNASESAASR